MFIEAILISIIIGLLRGGKLKRFKAINHKTMWILVFGMVIQYILVFLNRVEEIGSISKILLYTKQAQIISYILILIGIVTNFRFKSLCIVLVGFLMNFFAIMTNGWRRPILLEGVKLTNSSGLYEMIEMGKVALYTPIVESTKYPILGDIIIFAEPYPISRIISLGDLIISFGIFALIQEIMLGKSSFMKGYRL
ncbi:MAG: DUF5317 domain-containing protein [Tissierellia bacterium]|nr:DUF5317 domain-containing protein [Tissierellia bacterium]